MKMKPRLCPIVAATRCDSEVDFVGEELRSLVSASSSLSQTLKWALLLRRYLDEKDLRPFILPVS